MRVLVTGGSGVAGTAAVTALVARGHQVRLLSRHAVEAARDWPHGVEGYAADVASEIGVLGAAAGCDAVLHIAGIGHEEPATDDAPARTFQAINVEGTRHLLHEAERVGVSRFVFVSSLGADRGKSPYQESKLQAEELVRAFRGEWVIVRPGNVYGPGDEVVSVLLRMVRALPVVPVVDGDQPFQPIWHEDLGLALAAAIERDDVARRVLEVGGAETTTMRDLLARIGSLEGRDPLKLPVPDLVATAAAKAASVVGAPFPIDDTKLALLRESNVIVGENALETVLGIEPTSLNQGLRKLVETLPEQIAADGRGPLEKKLYWARVEHARRSPHELCRTVAMNLGAVIPVEGGPPPGQPLVPGTVFTLRLPVRGVIEMRVALRASDHLVLFTVEGHPLAGSLSFRFALDKVEVEVLVRYANLADELIMRTAGAVLQDGNWVQVVERIVELSGGSAPSGVQREHTQLEGDEAAAAEAWMAELVRQRKAERYEASERELRRRMADSDAARSASTSR